MRKDEIDQIVDAALERYSNAEPLAGMTDRILFRIRNQSSSSAKSWIAAGTIAASVLAGVLALHLSHPPTLEVPVPAVIPQMRQPIRDTKFVLRPVQRARRHFEMPKGPVFPLPTPMTADETSLVNLASRKPSLFPDLDGDPDPIVIPPLEVKPIQIELISDPN